MSVEPCVASCQSNMPDGKYAGDECCKSRFKICSLLRQDLSRKPPLTRFSSKRTLLRFKTDSNSCSSVRRAVTYCVAGTTRNMVVQKACWMCASTSQCCSETGGMTETIYRHFKRRASSVWNLLYRTYIDRLMAYIAGFSSLPNVYVEPKFERGYASLAKTWRG